MCLEFRTLQYYMYIPLHRCTEFSNVHIQRQCGFDVLWTRPGLFLSFIIQSVCIVQPRLSISQPVGDRNIQKPSQLILVLL